MNKHEYGKSDNDNGNENEGDLTKKHEQVQDKNGEKVTKEEVIVTAIEAQDKNDDKNDENDDDDEDENEKEEEYIICAGLSCLDMQLVGCTSSGVGEESIEHYDCASYCAGGSSGMTSAALGLLLRADNDNDNDYDDKKKKSRGRGQGRRVSIRVLTKLGNDVDGQRMQNFYKSFNADPSLCVVSTETQTSVAVLPVFADGRRGCFINLASNTTFTVDEMLGRLDVLSTEKRQRQEGRACTSRCRAFLFGYPHLLPLMRGRELRRLLCGVKEKLLQKRCRCCCYSFYTSSSSSHNDKEMVVVTPLIGVDLNGVTSLNHTPDILFPALDQVDVLHLNKEEAYIVCGADKQFCDTEKIQETKVQDGTTAMTSTTTTTTKAAKTESNTTAAAAAAVDTSILSPLHKAGCAIVLLSLGKDGCIVSITPNKQRLQSLTLSQISQWEKFSRKQFHIPAFDITNNIGATLNVNGAGDALFAGFCYACTWPLPNNYGGKKDGIGGGGGDDNSNETDNVSHGTVVSPEEAGMYASLVARQRCDSTTRDGKSAGGGSNNDDNGVDGNSGGSSGRMYKMEGSIALMERVKSRNLPKTIPPSLCLFSSLSMPSLSLLLSSSSSS